MPPRSTEEEPHRFPVVGNGACYTLKVVLIFDDATPPNLPAGSGNMSA